MNHFGFTNNFLSLTNDVLAQLHEESTLENHHYYVGMLLLQVFFLNKIYNTGWHIKSGTYRPETPRHTELLALQDLK